MEKVRVAESVLDELVPRWLGRGVVDFGIDHGTFLLTSNTCVTVLRSCTTYALAASICTRTLIGKSFRGKCHLSATALKGIMVIPHICLEKSGRTA